MCYNCGCGDPDDDHGNSINLTTTKLQQMADANDLSLEETMDNVYTAIEEQMEDELDDDEEAVVVVTEDGEEPEESDEES